MAKATCEHQGADGIKREKPPGRSQPARMCVGCREPEHPQAMIRLVADADGRLQIDRRHRIPGRGVYVHRRRACLERAIQRRAFHQALGLPVEPGDREELWQRMSAAAEQRFQERLSLARRAGAVVVGVEMVRLAMRENLALLLFVAADAGEGTSRQLAQNALRKGIRVADWIGGRLLARAVGLDYLSALAVTREPFASDLEILCALLKEPSESSPRCS